ncbi:hypothetical protein V5799_003256 [Amblyomma americanum]|uniref:Major facilitator superfamily (MFS) profile domain-containing protein n=1 Tax=Amblyomma americanum TaxID=6943 RepID=A0AAQ4D9H2_AMBAM
MRKTQKVRRKGSKPVRRNSGFQTPPSEVQPSSLTRHDTPSGSSFTRRTRSFHRTSSLPSGTQLARSGSLQSLRAPAALGATTPSSTQLTFRPRSRSLQSLQSLRAPATLGATAPLATQLTFPPTPTYPSAISAAPEQSVTAFPATRTSRTAVHPNPTRSSESLHSSPQLPPSSRQYSLPANPRGSERPLKLGASYPTAVTRSTSLGELMALRSLRQRAFSGHWGGKGQGLLSPLLTRLRSSSASSNTNQTQQPVQQRQGSGAPTSTAPSSMGSEERTRPSEKRPSPEQHQRSEQRDFQDSMQSVVQSRRSLSRTSLSLQQDHPATLPPIATASTVRREDASLLMGRHGPFQAATFHFGMLAALVLPFYTLPLQIAQHDVDHWCARPKNVRNISDVQWKRHMIPRTEDGRFSRCRMYAEWNSSDLPTAPCTSWEYAPSAYGNSVVQEFGLVCERAWIMPLSCCAFSAGAICALLVTGPLADRWGRKPVVQFSVVVIQAAGLVILLSAIVNSFLAMRFLLGAAASTLFNTSFVLVVEVIAPERRTLYSMVVMMGRVFGAVIAAAFMWLQFSWHVLQLASMVPCFMMLRFIANLVESPRWLLARAHMEEAEAVILHAATLNGENLFEVRRQWARARRDLERCCSEVAPEAACCETVCVLGRWNSIILYYFWTVTALTSQLASLKIHYLNFYPAGLLALCSVLSVPTGLAAIVSAAHLGRRLSQAGALFFAAAFSLMASSISDDHIGLSAALLLSASISVDASQTIGTLYAAEVYPTVVRCSGLALCTAFSAAASIPMPLAVYWDVLPVSSVPLGVMSLPCAAAAFFAMRLPDTKDRTVLPDQLSEAVFEASPVGTVPAVVDTSPFMPLQGRHFPENSRPHSIS